jgi:hypothetical protein
MDCEWAPVLAEQQRQRLSQRKINLLRLRGIASTTVAAGVAGVANLISLRLQQATAFTG